MSIADLMQAMADAGAPMEAILIAVRAIEAKEAEIEARRAADRDRKRRQRDKSRDADGNVTGRSRDLSGTTTGTPPVLDKETLPPEPPIKEINPTPRASTARARPDTRLPSDWEPEPLIAGSPTAVIVAAWEPGRLERELSKFRDHYRAAPGAKGLARDWQAKWRTWITNAETYRPTEHRNGNRPHHDRPSGWAPRPGMEGAEPAYLDD